MRTKAISQMDVSTILTLMMLTFITVFLIFAHSSAMAAGNSSRSRSDSSYDKRQKANVYFKKGLDYQEQGQYEKAADQYIKAIKRIKPTPRRTAI